MSAERGSAALTAAMALLAVAGALVAAVATLARTEVALVGERRTAAVALAAADACLADVVAEVPAGWEMDALLAGPDGIAGTADDGGVAAPADCTVTATGAPGPVTPFRVAVQVTADAGAGRRMVDAVVGRAAAPGAGAVVWVADGASLSTVAGTLALDGSNLVSPAAALAAPGDPTALDAWLVHQAPSVGVVPGTGAPVFAPAPPVVALATRAIAAGALGPGALAATAPAPVALIASATDVVIAQPRVGAGLLVVQGVLDIQASLAFTGVVAASGGVRVATGATLAVTGALWIGQPAHGVPALVVDGDAAVRADATAVAAADALLALPRRGRVLGLHDAG